MDDEVLRELEDIVANDLPGHGVGMDITRTDPNLLDIHIYNDPHDSDGHSIHVSLVEGSRTCRVLLNEYIIEDVETSHLAGLVKAVMTDRVETIRERGLFGHRYRTIRIALGNTAYSGDLQ